MEKVQSPNQVAKLTRPLTERKFWKAKEWENWALYYSVPILALKISEKHLKYWILLVESLHILLGSEISEKELKEADKMLKKFVKKTEKYFTIQAMTIGIHFLMHFSEAISNWGPAWSHSCYPFESANNKILKAIKSSKGAILQIIRYTNIVYAEQKLESRIEEDTSSTILNFCKNKNSLVKKHIKMPTCIYFGIAPTTPHTIEIASELGLSSASVKECHRMIKDNCLYLSCAKENKKSNDYYAKTVNNKLYKNFKIYC